METIWGKTCTSMAYLFAVYVTGIEKSRSFPEYIEDELAGYLCDIETMLRSEDRRTILEVREIAKQQLFNLMIPYRVSAKRVKNSIDDLAGQFDPIMAVDWYGKIADEVEKEMEARKGEKHE